MDFYDKSRNQEWPVPRSTSTPPASSLRLEGLSLAASVPLGRPSRTGSGEPVSGYPSQRGMGREGRVGFCAAETGAMRNRSISSGKVGPNWKGIGTAPP